MGPTFVMHPQSTDPTNCYHKYLIIISCNVIHVKHVCIGRCNLIATIHGIGGLIIIYITLYSADASLVFNSSQNGMNVAVFV